MAELACELERRKIESLRPQRLAMGDREKLAELCARFELTKRLEALAAVARPSVLLLGEADEVAVLGTSRSGGDPDVGAGFEWPQANGKPLSFLEQVDLASMQELVPEPTLPSAGLLSFFYAATDQPWGRPHDRGQWLVQFTALGTRLRRVTSPSGAERFPLFALKASRELTLPFMRTEVFRSLGFDDTERQRYDALYEAHLREYCLQPFPKSDLHRFLGHPDAIQGDMSRRLEYDEAGVDLDDVRPELEEAARKWRLLFQLGSDFNQSMCWGDNGRLFFWLREADLAAHRFAEARLQLQCH